MTTLALLGAGGKMGCRVTDRLKNNPDYRMLYVETGERGLASLTQRGLAPTPREEAIRVADAVILALPDRVLGNVAREIVPQLRPGCLVITLDPAAAHAGELPVRPDISYFVAHPCHPNVFDHFDTQAERDDFFGGTHARQAIVCALMQGPEEHYALGERIARDSYAPVTRSHRITVEQMAILEPTMAETCGIALVMALREALEETVRRGVPRAAAEDFMFGHIKVELGIGFGRAQFPFSDGAKLIGEYGRRRIFQRDWAQPLFAGERQGAGPDDRLGQAAGDTTMNDAKNGARGGNPDAASGRVFVAEISAPSFLPGGANLSPPSRRFPKPPQPPKLTCNP